jgi:epoxide hydrolase-like predicted phosphatase
MDNKIKAVIFDVGGVLALGKFVKIKGKKRRAVHEYISQKIGISVDQWFDSIDYFYPKAIEGKISEKKTLDKISKNLNINKNKLKNIIIQAYKKNFIQNKRLYSFAFNLKKQGYKIAVLSNQWYFSKKAIIFPRYMKKFNVVVISCDVGMRKPNPKIYKMIIKKLKLSPRETIFIDDFILNIQPAKKLGMKTILFKNNNQLFRDLKKFNL